MKPESWSRKASWVLALASILIIAYQHIELRKSRANEWAADVHIAQLALENSALKLAARKQNEALTEWLLFPQLIGGVK